MRKIIITIILFIVSNIMYSQDSDDFQYVATAENGNMVYVLFEKENYGTKEFWQKMTYPLKTIKGKSGKLTKSGGGYSLQYIKMNCAEKEYWSTDMIIYDRNGKSKNRPEYYDQHNAKVIPGSVMSAVHRYIYVKMNKNTPAKSDLAKLLRLFALAGSGGVLGKLQLFDYETLPHL